jgi:hypothetical protein
MANKPTAPIPDGPRHDRWGSLIKPLSDLAITFGRDRLSLTAVACLALVAVVHGSDAIPTLGFASLFIIAMPLLRYFKLLD